MDDEASIQDTRVKNIIDELPQEEKLTEKNYLSHIVENKDVLRQMMALQSVILLIKPEVKKVYKVCVLILHDLSKYTCSRKQLLYPSQSVVCLFYFIFFVNFHCVEPVMYYLLIFLYVSRFVYLMKPSLVKLYCHVMFLKKS